METNHNNEPRIDAEPLPATAGFDVVHAPALVVGDRGAGWIVEGWDLFKLAIPAWLAIALACTCWLLLTDKFPVLRFADLILNPVWWTAGLLLACQANYRRQPVRFNYLLAGFRCNFGRLIAMNLILLGLSLLIASLLMGELVLKVANSEQLQSLLEKIGTPIETPDEASISRLLGLLQQLDAALGLRNILIRFLFVLLLILPLAAAGWLAPALESLGNCDIKTALWYSLQATIKNIWPFTIYGVLLLIMAILALLPFRVGFLLLIPLYYLSMYLSYRDIFVN